MVDSTDQITIKVSSGNSELLRTKENRHTEDFGYWQSVNSDAGQAWIELIMPQGRCLTKLSVQLPWPVNQSPGDSDGLDTFTPRHVQLHIARIDEEYAQAPHWESLEFWNLGKVGTLVVLPVDFPSRTVRARLSIKSTVTCGLNTRVQSICAITKRLKRQREVPDRIWEDRKFVDCRVFSNDGSGVDAHRVALATASPVFERMLLSSMQEGKDRAVHLQAPLSVVKVLVQYCYGLFNVHDDLTLEDMLALLQQAHLLELTALCEEVAGVLVDKMDEQTVVDIVKGLRIFYKAGVLEDEWAAAVKKNPCEPGADRSVFTS
mmetsp:Transcript_53363/g.98417  ORF Transcript_53363/g.98417 Transcript_53363/m.98417 type:complete len:319 (-) Transcript_53363:113-1069(-)